jgi:hypothetical protein
MDEPTKIIIPGKEDDEESGGGYSPTVVFEPSIREITHTTLADSHADRISFNQQLTKDATYLGDGFHIHEEPVLVRRGPDGGIVELTPLAQIPGVHYERGRIVEEDAPPVEGKTRETPVLLSRSDRDKLRHILATRLFKNYATEASLRDRTRYNPIRDGLPKEELADDDPRKLAPGPQLPLYRATEGEVYDYLLRFVASRAKVIDTKRFGGGTLADMAVRIE